MSTKKKGKPSSNEDRARGRDFVLEAEEEVERAVEVACRVRFRSPLEQRLRMFGPWTCFDHERAFAVELAAERLGYKTVYEAAQDDRMPEVVSDAIEAAIELGL